MDTLAQTFGRPVGYSDHTEGEIACLAAVARGACVIEKHFTLDRSLPGPDHATSSEPDDFARLVHHIRETERTLGSRYRRPTEVERANMVGMRRSIVTNQAVPAGAVLSEDMLVFKRPATGIPPRDLPAVLGRRTSRALAADQILDWADIGEHA
jgi:sialic acid synthase SpsE